MRAISYLLSLRLNAWFTRPTISAEIVPDDPAGPHYSGRLGADGVVRVEGVPNGDYHLAVEGGFERRVILVVDSVETPQVACLQLPSDD